MRHKTFLMLFLSATLWGTPAMAIGGSLGDVPATPQAAQVSKAVDHGLRLYYQGDYVAAVARFSQAITEHPDDIAARYYLGYSHYRMGAYAEARNAFKQAYDLNPDFVPLTPEAVAR